jgi:hypothetical protein
MGSVGMKHKNPLAVLALFGLALTASPAFAHSFSVALVQPVSSAEAEQFRKGFMLATTQRDSHPDETSDGHLGGLDSYVSVVPALGAVAADTDIVVVPASLMIDGEPTAVVLRPGQSPFADAEQTGVARFVAAYSAAYGQAPTAEAAQGFNAAQRIEVAVRAQGSTDDRAALRRSFAQTADDFSW